MQVVCTLNPPLQPYPLKGYSSLAQVRLRCEHKVDQRLHSFLIASLIVSSAVLDRLLVLSTAEQIMDVIPSLPQCRSVFADDLHRPVVLNEVGDPVLGEGHAVLKELPSVIDAQLGILDILEMTPPGQGRNFVADTF